MAKPLALVLEDDDSAREALALLLGDWGAEVAHGIDGAALVAGLDGRTAQARWLITDYNLGASPNGVAAARLIVQRVPHIRVLVLTGSVGATAEREAADAGFEILRKPVPPETILAWLELD
jgi:CheY-like chemotaxis protein